ncbi:hypothetical protein BN59_02282 [Legionella massiliensis]|uniref:Uncharacterized protein n=1 Tax=Legionella massiliensis TaxID=1034943 RepID=A0A078KYI3_9GAMM|nr:hypothetical protein [Legionella massiliensis]CDZ77986.1 hypothetical protein BN59_02282 [Legionella massiliensis]CEE13724.1 hypothetical protein BN1094_02282 [Legionella massiliensis]
MPSYRIESPVVIFNHEEYGERLLFQQGEANPRNELGKNGVTLHRWPGSMFYRTIKIQAAQIDEHGTQEAREFTVNRNSLIKYIGGDASSDDSDDALIRKLQSKLWISELNNPSQEEKAKQGEAGEHLRHAGQHNQRAVKHWSDPIVDFFKGSFLSWLYQVTIRSVNLIKVRFFLYGNEKDHFENGEILAKKRFHEAYAEVPAYRTHMTTYNGMPIEDMSFRDIPLTNKANYIKVQEHDSDTHLQGKYPERSKTDTSTGTTGKPTAWVRGERELDTVKKSLELAARIQFGDRRLNYVNAFALGPWATGLTTYELMRQTGSVFATGPDKEKILDELLRIAKYERHQLELAVDKLQAENPKIRNTGKKLIADLIEATFKAMLKTRDLKLADALNEKINGLSEQQQAFINKHKGKILAIAESLNKEKTQTIIAGYPPFLKDLAAFIKEKEAETGYSLEDFSVIGVVGGQAISEAMRDLLKKDGFNQIYSSYGASDLDINLGVETEDEMVVRQAIEQNPGLARELYGENKGLPMVFHYDTWNTHVECLDGEEEHEEKDSLVFTTTRDDRSSPRIRYDLGDKGRIYASSDVQALLAKYGIFHKPRTNLPLMFVWGRDSTVVFNGANLAFTELERAVENIDTEGEVLKKAFYTYHDQFGAEKLELWLELNDDVEIPEDMEAYAHALISKLASLNQDFRYQLESLDEGSVLPVVRFFKRGQSPISEAGGHRKQVLVFQKENLPEDYAFPAEEYCRGVAIQMSDDILRSEVQLSA